MAQSQSSSSITWVSFWLIALGLAMTAGNAFALEAREQAASATSGEQIEEARPVAPRAPQAPHRFWDSTNAALFAGVAGARALDYASTRHLRNNGINEWLLSNSVVDNKPLFVGIEAAGVGISIAVSYLFHRTDHHKLERWTSIVHISVGAGGSIHNYGLDPSPSTMASH